MLLLIPSNDSFGIDSKVYVSPLFTFDIYLIDIPFDSIVPIFTFDVSFARIPFAPKVSTPNTLDPQLGD